MCAEGGVLDPLIARGVVLAANVALVAIRAPHGQRSRGVPVARSGKGRLEGLLLLLAWIGFFLPLVWVFSPALSFADYPLRPLPLGAGAALLVPGLWLFHRSHADLGTNWSISLDLREGHRLVTGGVYARVRHPMYLSLILFSAGQALVLPNAVGAAAYLVPMLLITACRIGPEERMMREAFGPEWDAYAARTRRLVPGVW